MTTETLEKAGEIWRYLSSVRCVVPSDAIVICCSYDLRVCDHACDLLKRGISKKLIISGKFGNWTKHVWSKPEAEVFHQRAIENAVPESQIVLETEATNFGENISKTRAIIPDAKTVTFVSKPNSLMRLKLTAEAQWPEIKAAVSSPDISFPEEVSSIIGVWGVMHEMVGDLQRIQTYPRLGFQVPQQLPDDILSYYDYLVDQGFTQHLLPMEPTSLSSGKSD